MRIGLNLLPVVPGIGGAWHYVANLLAALAEHDRENEYIGFVTPESAPIFPRRKNFTAVSVSLRASLRPLRVVYESTVLPRLSRSYDLDCMHHVFGTLPLFGREPTVVTVFDLMAVARPRDFSLVKRSYLQVVRRRAARRATVLAPMSNATAETLHAWLGVEPERMVVVRPAVPPEFAPGATFCVAEFRDRHGIAENFWLCVAGPYRHKNFDRLIDAFAEMRRHSGAGWPLVIRGDATPKMMTRIAKAQIADCVLFLPWLTDREMSLLYSAASGLIFPSLYEGGGLPVLEAMACGCPVVASDLPTTREFASDAAAMFDPESAPDIARAMTECERSPEMRSRMSALGIARASQFNASAAAAACLDAYRAASMR